MKEQRKPIATALELIAVLGLFALGWVVYTQLNEERLYLHPTRYWYVFAALILGALPIAYFSRFPMLLGPAPSVGFLVSIPPQLGLASLSLWGVWFWGLTLLPAIGMSAAGHVLRLYVHSRELVKWRCPSCGYDLRATGGRDAGCSECGWNRPEDDA